MDNLKFLAFLAGISFGIWPLMMNRSGLSGNMSSIIFTSTILVCLLPFTLGSVNSLVGVNWWAAVGAGIIGAAGLASFNGMLSKASPENVSSLFVVMIVTQTVLPAVYHIAMNGGMTITKGLGFGLAIAGGILLVL